MAPLQPAKMALFQSAVNKFEFYKTRWVRIHEGMAGPTETPVDPAKRLHQTARLAGIGIALSSSMAGAARSHALSITSITNEQVDA